MTDFYASKMNSETRGIFSDASAITSNNYPENLGMMFVINAPFVFSACWSIAKTFLDERTVKKIQIVGSSYQKLLLEHVDAD